MRTALPDGTFRRLIVVCLAIGSNLPDADLLYTSLAGGPLTYILQHRGYTHTLLGALAGAAVLWIACALWMRHRRLRAMPTEQAWIAAACVAGVLLHLAMDFTNSYGVHPFWPFYNGWVYGDSVFIVEPLLWLAAVPLIFTLETRIARRLVALAVGAATLAVTAFGLVALPAMIIFLMLGAAMLAAGYWLSPPLALAAGIGLWLGGTALCGAASHLAAARLNSLATQEFATAHTLDRVLTPTPANPLCWDAWLVQIQDGREIMRQARVALWPGLIPVHACRGVNLAATDMSARESVPAPGDAGILWLQQYSMPAGRIARLALTQCRARAFMQFARVPFAGADAAGVWLGDLRFGLDRGFSRLRLSQPPQACEFPAVPWLPPRPELLRQGNSLQTE